MTCILCSFFFLFSFSFRPATFLRSVDGRREGRGRVGCSRGVVEPLTDRTRGAIINMFVVRSPVRRVKTRRCFHHHGFIWCVHTARLFFFPPPKRQRLRRAEQNWNRDSEHVSYKFNQTSKNDTYKIFGMINKMFRWRWKLISLEIPVLYFQVLSF